MTALVAAFTALGQQIAANNNAANAAHFAAVDAHLVKLDTEEGADEATIADTTAGLQAFLAAANPPAPVTGTLPASTAVQSTVSAPASTADASTVKAGA